jgi:primosomal protein N' (replication factor Y)
MSVEQQTWSVAVDAPFPQPLTYIIPTELVPFAKPGLRVRVPLGKRSATGVLLNSGAQASGEYTLKEISSVEEDAQKIPEVYLKWLTWVSQYYVFPLGPTLNLAFPPLKKSKEGASKSRKRSLFEEMQPEAARNLTSEQKIVVDSISEQLHEGFSAHLVHGVTGSGKTEIYLQLLMKTLAAGKKGLLLVPEISLTPQLIQRFASRFPDKVAVIHSQLTERERTDFWWQIRDGKKSILLGARSAQFCPIENLGLIVVDEEHEASFKQDEKLKYHGRDAAVMLAKFANIPIILGSATPSLESWRNAQEGKYKLHSLKERVENRELPQIQLIDMRKLQAEGPTQAKNRSEVKKESLPFWLSPELHGLLKQSLEEGQQAALFLNRRGAAALVICPSCGFTHQCPNCDINLTLHGKSHMICHYCDYHENFKVACPDCKEGEMTPVGLGTEALESAMQELFPGVRTARADRDEITNRLDLEDLIRKMETGEIDILIGTQMIAKGLDFKNLNLVGVILADIGFNIPDFRASERSFQLLTQVAGRAGRHIERGQKPGQVVIQTYNPEHPSLEFALRHDFDRFASQELMNRKELSYPPYGRIIVIRFQGNDSAKVQSAAKQFVIRSEQLKNQASQLNGVEILGPAPAPMAKLRGKYRYHVLLKSKDTGLLNSFYRRVLGDESWLVAGVRMIPDVDPLQLL